MVNMGSPRRLRPLKAYFKKSSMIKNKTIDSFFKRKASDCIEEGNITSISLLNEKTCHDALRFDCEEQPSKISKITSNEFDVSSLERDPCKRPQIWQHHVNQRDEIYIRIVKILLL